jgi:hypothetical protein
MVAAITLSFGTGCLATGRRFTPVAAPQIALTASGLTGPVRIGLLISGTSTAGQGADQVGRAAGARVAQYRLTQGRADVTLEVYDDHGTSKGAIDGIRTMLGRRVSGIVAATTGSHLDAALRQAAAAEVPVLLPYEPRDVAGATTSWFTGPSAEQVRDRLRTLLVERHLQHPYVLHADGTADEVAGLGPPDLSSALSSRESPGDAINPVVAAWRSKRIDSVVIGGSAVTQALLVAQLQGHAKELPVVLSPDALAPAFGDTLADRLAADGSATPSGRFLTAGAASVDASAQSSGDDAVALTAFLAAVRTAAQTPDVQSIVHAVPFGQEGAGTADPAAHDAVIALVRAAEKARSAAPQQVGAALGTLALGHAQGLAGPVLDLTAHRSFPATALVALASTTQDAGMRAHVADRVPAVTWFVLPAES